MTRWIFLLFASMSFGAAVAQDTLTVQVHGSVLNAQTDAPILEALVEWYDADGVRQAVNQTNSEGHYAFFVTTTGELELRVAENGYAAFSERISVASGESAKEFTIRLVPK